VWNCPQIDHSDTGKPVVRGYTIHGFTNPDGKPIRPPAWFLELLGKAASGPPSGNPD
jgi:acyl-CoA thioesterase FadM